MPQYSTIFSPVSDIDKIEEALKGRTDVTWHRASTTKFRVRIAPHSLELNAKIRERPGDEVSRMVLGAFNFFDRIKNADEARKKEVGKLILSTKMVLGIVAEPEFDDDDVMFDIVLEIATHLNATVFAGDALIDGFGRLLLDSAGAFDP